MGRCNEPYNIDKPQIFHLKEAWWEIFMWTDLIFRSIRQERIEGTSEVPYIGIVSKVTHIKLF